MPRTLNRRLTLSALSLSLAVGIGCKRGPGSSDTSPAASASDDANGGIRRKRRVAGMPRPLRLPATSPIVVHVQRPSQAIGGLQAYAPELPDARTLLQQLVGTVPGTAFESQLTAAVDLERPWDAASVDGQLIVHLPILPGRVESVAGLLSDKPPVGSFGAVDLQRASGPAPKLAWLDRATNTLTLADDERGLATGSKLAGAYGKQPLRVQLDGAEARKYVAQFELQRLDLQGAGPHDFEATVEGVPPEVLARLGELEPGALTGLLESSVIAAGGSSKYANYAADVKKILSDLKRTVDRQSFLIQGNLENLRTRLADALRSWNGRTMVGTGPANHLLLGFGAADPKHMGGALFHLINGVIDNLGMARSIGINVPKLRFKRNAVRAAEQNISVLVLEGARKLLPPELASLVDDRGELRIAMAFPERMGAGMFVLGRASESTMTRWLEDTARATTASDSAEHFLAGTMAVDPASFAPLLQGGDPAILLRLTSDREPTRVTVVRNDATFNVRVRGPEVVVRARRVGARVGVEGKAAPTRTTTSPSTSPTRGKPARVAPGRGPGKPVD